MRLSHRSPGIMPEPQGSVIRWIAVRAFSFIALSLLVACDGGLNQDDGAMASLNAGTAANAAAASSVEAVAADARPAAKPEATIPAAMLGRWTGLADDCADAAAPMELRVENHRLLFYESEGRVTAITSRADGSTLVDAAFTGEGQSWTRRLTLILQDGGQRLRIVGDDDRVTRKRCPA